MTDKLADDCRMAFENYWCEIGMRRAMPFWKDTGTDGEYVDRKMADAWRHWQSAWNTRHEATKAATSDDVREHSPALENAPQWQPIETAPKDGTQILGWNKADGYERKPYICWFGKDYNYEDDDALWLKGDGDGWSTGYYFTPCEPTHWMPLPAAPNGGA